MNGHAERMMKSVVGLVLACCLNAGAGDLTVDNLTVNQSATVTSNVVIYGDIVIPDIGPIPTNGLKLLYTFDSDSGGQVFDSSGNGNNGLIVGGVTYEAGKQGLAARFSSSSMHIVCDSQALNVQGWTNITVSMWAMPVSLTTYSCIIARGQYTAGSTSSGFMIRTPGYSGYPGIDAYMYTNAGAQMSVSYAPRTQANVWYHIVMVHDGQTMKLYINGALASSSTAPGPRALYDISGSKMVIGTCAATPFMYWGDQYFNGRVDDLRIYNRALTDTEIARLMNFTMAAPSGKFNGVGNFPKGIGYVAPLGDLSMGVYTNKP